MGEYAKLNNERIKIGTCEAMYYLRFDDRFKVTPEPDSLNPHNAKNLFWRLPYPDEDMVKPGCYKDFDRGILLYRAVDKEIEPFEEDFPDTGIVQAKHDCGLLINATCYHGQKLPDGNGDLKPFWNGRARYWFELIHLKNSEKHGIMPVIRCRYCRRMWSYTPDEWPRILEFVPDKVLRQRLIIYSPDYIEHGRR